MNLFNRFIKSRNNYTEKDFKFNTLCILIENMVGHVLAQHEYKTIHSMDEEQIQLFIKWIKEAEEV